MSAWTLPRARATPSSASTPPARQGGALRGHDRWRRPDLRRRSGGRCAGSYSRAPLQPDRARQQPAQGPRQPAPQGGSRGLDRPRGNQGQPHGHRRCADHVSFAHDVYPGPGHAVLQEDLALVQEGLHPGAQGEQDRGLHLIVEGAVPVLQVEVVRGGADPHHRHGLLASRARIHYKLAELPRLRRRLVSAADTAAAMDAEMEALRQQMRQLKEVNRDG
ncbi:hypothetical protein QJS66_15255 [Kocuria rhizophila]|nr:hypothetical protein QJS66_15255 [Kocuria rhizophila]